MATPHEAHTIGRPLCQRCVETGVITGVLTILGAEVLLVVAAWLFGMVG